MCFNFSKTYAHIFKQFSLCFILLQTTSSESISVCPCLPQVSILFKGKCMRCFECGPIVNITNERNITRFTDENKFLCPLKESDLEQIEVSDGSRYLKGRDIKIVTIERHPFVKIINKNFSGVVFELIYALQTKYNFSSTIFFPYDGNWGSRLPNGTWNGMVGQVLRKEADLGAAGFSVTLDRAKAIRFSMSYHLEPTAILIPAPQSGSKLTILIRPLSPEVWLAVFTTICLLVPALFLMHIISIRIQEGKDAQKQVDAFQLIGNLFQFIIGSLVQESITSPVNKTTKFLVVIWWFLTLVVANIYLGYMVSFLSAPKLYNIVDNLEGLLNQNTLRWTYRKNTAVEDLFRSSTSGVYKAIGKGALSSDLVSSDVQGVNKTLTGEFAFLKEKSYLDVALGNDFEKSHQCRLTVAKETFFTVGTSLILQKGSKFLQLLDREILNSMSSGLMSKWKALHWPENLWCVDAASYIIKTQPPTRKLAVDDCQGAFFILICGISAASLAFLVEIRKTIWNKLVCHSRSQVIDKELDGFRIIVIPVKDDYYRKMSNYEPNRLKKIAWNF